MKCKEISRYKDGGTLKVLAEDGNFYFIDKRINSNTISKIYTNYPTKENATIIDIELEFDNNMPISSQVLQNLRKEVEEKVQRLTVEDSDTNKTDTSVGQ